MKNTVIYALVMSVAIFSGCDSLRRLAGRPTSGELAARKAELEQEAVYDNGRDTVSDILPQDLPEKLPQDLPEKLADKEPDQPAVKEAKPSDPRVISVSKVHGFESDPLESLYCVVLGAFVDPANAQNLCDRVTKAGYDCRTTVFGNGYLAVTVCACETYAEVSEAIEKLSKESFCPSDAWILYNN